MLWHLLGSLRSLPLSTIKSNLHTNSWNRIWIERQRHVCNYSKYNSLNAMTATSTMNWEAVHFNEKHWPTSHSSKRHFLNDTRHFLLHLYNSYRLFSFVSLFICMLFDKKKFFCVSGIITSLHLQQEEDVVWDV